MLKLSEGQEKAWDLLNNPRENVFLTGLAGTGKSTVLLKYLRSIPRVVRLASTGAAAVLIEGRTFHSFFGLGVMAGPDKKIIGEALASSKVKKNLRYNTDTIVIDEISMLDSRALHLADQIARKIRGKDVPWGGLRIIACGDFAQLPPISDYGSPRLWAFESQVWKDSNFRTCLLTEIMRVHDDVEFLDVLNSIRIGEVTEQVRDFLNRHKGTKGIEARIFPRRAQADAYNKECLENLHTHNSILHTVRTTFSGNDRFYGSLSKNMPVPEELVFKIGALVMLRKNDYETGLYVNGSMGTILDYDPISGIKIRLVDWKDDYFWLEQAEFNWHDGAGEVVARARNYPITLAYGNTIHKIQGATMSQLAANINNVWEPGQAYVALSRVRSATGLGVIDWNSQGIKADKKVKDFYNGLKV